MKQFGLPGGLGTTEAAASKEIAMAKAKKSAAARNKSSRRGKAGGKPAREKAAKRAARKKSSSRSKANIKSARDSAAKRAAAKKPKSKVRHANKLAPKPEIEVERATDVTEARQVLVEVPAETSIINIIEEPTSVLAVVEYQEERQAPEAVETGQVVVEGPVETTIIKAIEEPAADVVVVEEHRPVPTATPDGGHGRGEGIGPAGRVDFGSDLDEQPEQKVA
jgi:hypothetical protein